MQGKPLYPGENLWVPIWSDEVSKEADWMQVGDITTDGEFIHGTSFVEDYEKFPDNHTDTSAMDWMTCVVYWSPRTVFLRGLELSIQEEVARKETLAAIRRGDIKGTRPHILVPNAHLTVST